MNELPKGWAQAGFGQLFDFKGGSQPPKATFSDHQRPGYVRLLQIRDFESDAKAVFIKDHSRWPKCSADDIMIGRYGASVGRVLTGKAGAYNVALVRMIFERELLDASWVRMLLLSDHFQEPLKRISRSAQNGFNKADLEEIEVPLAPLPDQRRIVAKIDSLTAKSGRIRARLDHIPQLVEKYKRAILAAAFRGDLTGDSDGFDRRALGTLASLITKGASPRWQGFEYVEDGILFIRSQNVGWGKLLLEDRAYLPPEFEAKHQRSVLRTDDVMLNIVGASIGRAAVATSALEGANCNQAVAIIRLSEKDAAPEFVCYWLLSPEAQSAIASGTVDFARGNFSLGDIRKLQLPWPTAEKRDEIVRRIEIAFGWIDRLASETASARKLIDHLDQAILAKAFRGELVPQDPNDEPARVLLERIRAEREDNRPARRGRRTSAGSPA